MTEVQLGFRCLPKLRVTKAITYLIRVQGFRNSVQMAKHMENETKTAFIKVGLQLKSTGW